VVKNVTITLCKFTHESTLGDFLKIRLHLAKLRVAASAYTVRYSVFFGMATVNIFSSVNKIILTLLFRMAESCMAVRFIQLWSMPIFSTNISQGVAMHLIFGGIFNYYFTKIYGSSYL